MKIIVCVLLLLSTSSFGQNISIIPIPVKLEVGTGNFTLKNSTSIAASVTSPEINSVVNYLQEKIRLSTGFVLKSKRINDANIKLHVNIISDIKLSSEGYALTITPKQIIIKANTAAGLFYGVQTLLQLLPKEIESTKVIANIDWKIPSVSILDYPQFRWRGLMLDVSRHFFPKEYIKNYLDQMARYKFNRFHWHLTDDNGWRIEIKSFPKLTEIGAWRVPRVGTFGSNEPPRPDENPTYGGYYSQEDIKEIIQYAKERYIEVIPEIDVPGHSMAAIASYPKLCITEDVNIKVNPGSNFSVWFTNEKFEMNIDNSLNPIDEYVYDFLDKVFGEVADLFPFEYIHIGGDECYHGYWERDPQVQSFMKKNSIKTGEALQSYFTKRVIEILSNKKKKVIGWDEILRGGLDTTVAVMKRDTIKSTEHLYKDHFLVISPAPMYYLDLCQGESSIEPPVYNAARLKDTYAFEIPTAIDMSKVLGGQGNLWTEQIPTTQQVEYMTYPRAFAIAESMWSYPAQKHWNKFIARVEDHFLRLDVAKINYANSMYDPIIEVKNKTNMVIKLFTEINGLDLYYTFDNTIPNHYSPKYTTPIKLPEGADIFRVVSYRNGKPLGKLITIKTEDLIKRAVE